MKEKGSIFILTLMAVLVLALISAVGITMAHTEMKTVSYVQRAISAFYIADGGANYGYAEIAKAPPTGEFSQVISNMNQYANLPDGRRSHFYLPQPTGTDQLSNPRIMGEFVPPFPPGVSMGEGFHFLAVQFYVTGELYDRNNHLISSKTIDTASLAMFYGEY
ncbi:MAG: pilus assembly PilX N-terminal domain-containing protein [Candidatus Aminicenantes bacterium]|nr:pilus assembly PilX N-terminal domain-containing protein [Candidatus Aminicenantes bacterium]